MPPRGKGVAVRSRLVTVAFIFAGALTGLVVGCSGSDAAVPARPVTAPSVPDPLAGFRVAMLVVDGDLEWPVMVADTPELRRQGLMNVADLGDWAGMAFVYSEPTESSFWMKDTPIPLTVLWVGVDGAILAAADMVPCGPDDDCVSYAPGIVHLWALEVRTGEVAGLGITAVSTLVLRL